MLYCRQHTKDTCEEEFSTHALCCSTYPFLVSQDTLPNCTSTANTFIAGQVATILSWNGSRRSVSFTEESLNTKSGASPQKMFIFQDHLAHCLLLSYINNSSAYSQKALASCQFTVFVMESNSITCCEALKLTVQKQSHLGRLLAVTQRSLNTKHSNQPASTSQKPTAAQLRTHTEHSPKTSFIKANTQPCL